MRLLTGVRLAGQGGTTLVPGAEGTEVVGCYPIGGCCELGSWNVGFRCSLAEQIDPLESILKKKAAPGLP